MSEKTLGQVAFEAYNESKGGLTYDGKPIPPWDELSGDRAAVHSAWEVAARAAADEMIGRWGVPLFLREALREAGAAKDVSPRKKALAITKIEEAAMWWSAAFEPEEPGAVHKFDWNSPVVTAGTREELGRAIATLTGSGRAE